MRTLGDKTFTQLLREIQGEQCFQERQTSVGSKRQSEKSKVTGKSLIMDTSEFKETQSKSFRTCGNIENCVMKEDVT